LNKLCKETGKTSYHSRYEAIKAIEVMVRDPAYRREKGVHLEAYHCPHCNSFHVGNNMNVKNYRKRDR
jgi:hypothetical protein